MVERVEAESGKHSVLPSNAAKKIKALQRGNGELRQVNGLLCEFISRSRSSTVH